MLNMNGFMNYGDVSFMEHGGTFIKNESGREYWVVTVDPIEDGESPAWEINYALVDIDDDWIDKDAVESCCDKSDTDELFVSDLVSYYGMYELSGGSMGEVFTSESDAINYLDEIMSHR